MGYESNIYVIKKNVLEREVKLFPDVPFDILFGNRLYAWVNEGENNWTYYSYDEEKEFVIPEDERGRDVAWTYRRTLYHTKTLGEKYEDVRIIDRDTFNKLCDEIRPKLISVNLLSQDEDDIDELLDLANIYKSLMLAEIDWDEEVLIYECG